jgi:hypothetical protein
MFGTYKKLAGWSIFQRISKELPNPEVAGVVGAISLVEELNF